MDHQERPPGAGPTASAASAARWPSLEEQLRRAGAIHGSELEKLIQSNQDVSLLRPEEHENDGIDIPLWLRVHYRKNHPELKPAAKAVGDYPEALENVEAWLKTHQNMNKG